MRRIVCIAAILGLSLVAATVADERSGTPSAAGLEYFEKHVRPLLADHCYACHGPKKQESGLALNSTARLQSGGDRGQVLAPGEPEESLLIQAVRYTGDDLKMPPRGKLKDEQIAALVEWVKLGAPAPRDEAPASEIQPSSDFNLAERRKHWSYQPVHSLAVPSVAGSGWTASPIDRFILARLETAGLTPAPPAERRTLIRRVTFDLTGLPPTPDEVARFLSDQRPDAYERLVDRLLASPRYGERFGRHWLDVVRYCETLGFEFDYDLHNAWRYRDYVIRAFNDDLPYEQFVVEHLAGDLVEQPRRHPLGGWNESILATGFWWMYEGKQTPVDIRQYQADCIDNQLDVLGKAFLGQTIACARCHDHKFDAISTRDYYALAGYLKSSRFQQAFIDPPEHWRPAVTALTKERQAIAGDVTRATTGLWLNQAGQIGKYMAAAAKVDPASVKFDRNAKSGERRRNAEQAANTEAKEPNPAIEKAAAEAGLDVSRLDRWVKALAEESLAEIDHPLHVWSLANGPAAKRANELETAINQELTDAARNISASRFFDGSLNDWTPTGAAFDEHSVRRGEVVIGASLARPISRLTSGGVDSGLLSPRLQGELRSPSFSIDKKFVHVQVAGSDARLNLVIDGYTLIMNPMYGRLTVAPSHDRLAWHTIPVDRWVGHRAYFELSDSTIPMHGLNPPPSSARTPVGNDGYINLRQIVLSDDPSPPAMPSKIVWRLLETAGTEPSVLPEIYQRQVMATIFRWTLQDDQRAPNDEEIGLLNWLLENGLLDAPQSAEAAEHGILARILERYRSLEAAVPAPYRTPAFADGTGEDEYIFLRGNYRTLGEVAVRGLPEALFSEPLPTAEGSGRLRFAQRLVVPSNPLLPRVIVNRLWQHHFGEGIVRTPDDFGRMGQEPTHPELLDHLADELIRGGWSLKNVQRRMVTANSYRMSSAECRAGSGELSIPHSALRAPHLVDPENRLLHRMPIRRLEAEAVRDSVLAASGRLDETMHGPSTLPFVTAYMEGRGKPQSGPLDGSGRRSIYINARRNFLTPLLLAFDYPVTFTPIGRRGAATIPAQALTLMNDPLVVGEAARWADRTLAVAGTSAEQRIEALYQTAFSRPPSADELASSIDFLQEQSLRHGGGSDDPRVWTDLCHVLINVKEFIFIE